MEHAHIRKFFQAIGLRTLSGRLSQPWQKALYTFLNGCLSIGILAAAAAWTGSPFVFPSLGPTAYMLYLTPLSAAASPRDALLGHAIGILAGLVAVALCGLAFVPETPAHPVNAARAAAAALSLGGTAALMVLCRVNHAPACATTLIVSLGLISQPEDLLLIELSVFLLVAQALLLNRLVGFPYPLWKGKANR